MYKRVTGAGARAAARHLAGLLVLAHMLGIWQFAFASVSFSKSHSYIKSHKKHVLVVFHGVCIDLTHSRLTAQFWGGGCFSLSQKKVGNKRASTLICLETLYILIRPLYLDTYIRKDLLNFWHYV